MTPLKSNNSTGNALMMCPAQYSFFEPAAM
jgi:hypothetical protein